MTAPDFDTLSAARDLQAAGFETGQAEAIVTTMQQASAPGVTTDEFNAGLAQLRAYIDTALAQQQAYMETSLAELRAHMDTGLANQTAALAEFKADIYRTLWLQAGAIVATLTGLQVLMMNWSS